MFSILYFKWPTTKIPNLFSPHWVAGSRLIEISCVGVTASGVVAVALALITAKRARPPRAGGRQADADNLARSPV